MKVKELIRTGNECFAKIIFYDTDTLEEIEKYESMEADLDAIISYGELEVDCWDYDSEIYQLIIWI